MLIYLVVVIVLIIISFIATMLLKPENVCVELDS